MMRRNDARRLAFDLLKPAQDVEPDDFGFQVVDPGDEVDPRFRPHYEMYVPRTAVPFESRDNAGSGQERDTQDLRSELEEGSGLVLIGSPTTGKSRTLFEIVRGLSGHTVLRPKPDHAPSLDELSVVPRGDIVVLLDNLDEYAQAAINLPALCRDLTAAGSNWVVAAACRDGAELNVISDAIDPGFRRCYGDIPNKLWLQSPSPESSAEFALFVGLDTSHFSPVDYPTLGSITMRGALSDMRTRFASLAPDRQDCLRAMQLLSEAGVLPITHARVEIMMTRVFKRPGVHLRDIFVELGNLAFLRHPPDSDPVRPEAAYLDLGRQQPVVPYAGRKQPRDDFEELADALEADGDAEGLFGLGLTYGATLEEHAAALECFDRALIVQPEFPSALGDKGIALGRLDRAQDAIVVFDEVVQRYGDDPAPGLREVVAGVLFGKGVRLSQLGRSQDATDVYDELVRRYGDDPASALREHVAKALANKGGMLGQLDRTQDAIAAYDDVVDRYGDDPAPALRELVAAALFGKGLALGQLDRSQDAITVFEDVVLRYGDDPAPALREQVVRALVNMGHSLGQFDRSQDELAVYDEVVQRYGHDVAPALREEVATALVNKGITLGELGRSKDEIEVYEEVVQRYGDDAAPALREQVARALVNEGIALSQLDRAQDAITVVEDVVQRYGDDPAPALRESVARAFAVKGTARLGLGQREEALRVLEEAWQMREHLPGGGAMVRQALDELREGPD